MKTTYKPLSRKEGSNMLHGMQLQCVAWFDMDIEHLVGAFLQTFPDEYDNIKGGATREYLLRRLILREFVVTNDAYFG